MSYERIYDRSSDDFSTVVASTGEPTRVRILDAEESFKMRLGFSL